MPFTLVSSTSTLVGNLVVRKVVVTSGAGGTGTIFLTDTAGIPQLNGRATIHISSSANQLTNSVYVYSYRRIYNKNIAYNTSSTIAIGSVPEVLASMAATSDDYCVFNSSNAKLGEHMYSAVPNNIAVASATTTVSTITITIVYSSKRVSDRFRPCVHDRTPI